MKAKHLLLVTAMCSAMGAVAQNANVYASALAAKQGADGKYEISFTLNADATSVDLNVGGKTYALTGQFLKGQNTALVDLGDLKGENMAWSLTAKGAPNTATVPVKVADKNTEENMDFYMARSIKVDNDMNSPYFGRIYVTESGNSASSRTKNGLYVFNAAFEDVTNQGTTPYEGNAGFVASSASPQRVFVAPDALYLCDWSDSHSGVWKVNPADLNADFKPVFAGERDETGLISNGGVPVAGSIVSIWVDGEGDNTVLYTFDEDYRVDGRKFPILQYNIGSLANPWGQVPSAVVFDNANGLAVNGSTEIVPDATGWWISQYRWLENASQPALIHYNTTTKTEDYNTATAREDNVLVGNSMIGGLAINEEGTLLAIASNDAIKVFDLGETVDGEPLLTLKYTITHGMAKNRVWGLTFDLAGNLYGAFDQGDGLGLWALPKADNQFTTQAPVSQAITVTGIQTKKGDVNGDGEVDVNDVNILINVVLGKEDGNKYDGRANVDGSGDVDVNDVNTLINIVLGK